MEEYLTIHENIEITGMKWNSLKIIDNDKFLHSLKFVIQQLFSNNNTDTSVIIASACHLFLYNDCSEEHTEIYLRAEIRSDSEHLIKFTINSTDENSIQTTSYIDIQNNEEIIKTFKEALTLFGEEIDKRLLK